MDSLAALQEFMYRSWGQTCRVYYSRSPQRRRYCYAYLLNYIQSPLVASYDSNGDHLLLPDFYAFSCAYIENR